MVKKIATALLCVALGSSLHARDISIGEKFVGLEVGAATIQADTAGIFGETEYQGDRCRDRYSYRCTK